MALVEVTPWTGRALTKGYVVVTPRELVHWVIVEKPSPKPSSGLIHSHRSGLERLVSDIRHAKRPVIGDVLAGLSVAMVLIPQSMAYADIAGLPPYVGLFAAAFPLLIFALFASSPYLQTGPVAVTSLLTIGVLATQAETLSTDELVKQAALLAIIVGVIRFVLGVFRLGVVAYLLAEPVMIGFTSGAGVVIIGSQLPKALGLTQEPGGALPNYSNPILRTLWTFIHPGEWQLEALFLGGVTLLLMLGGRKLHKLFPGVLFAVIFGVIYSRVTDYSGKVIGDIPEGLPPFSLDLPWADIPTLLVGGTVLALVGFAEPASIARTFAGEDGDTWSASQEFLSSGLANLVAGISSAYPVGGSFSRSSVNRFAGAQTKWSGGVTGLAVLAFLPFAGVLEPLPDAVLGSIVVGAVYTLVKPRRLVSLWKRSKSQAVLTYATFAITLITPPEVYYAVIIGIIIAFAHHVLLNFRLDVSEATDGSLKLRPVGMLWFATNRALESKLDEVLRTHPDATDIEIDLGDIPSIDSGIADAIGAGLASHRDRSLVVRNAPQGSEALLKGLALTLV